jgi:hypothetical protein
MTPCLPGLFSDEAPLAPQRVTVPPVVRAARASGRRVGHTSAGMRAYRDALIEFGPAADPQIADRLGWGVSSCCGRRGDWNALAPAGQTWVVAVDRVKVGKASQCRWAWVGTR